eukprot:2503312-Rhodomonas_salina.1
MLAALSRVSLRLSRLCSHYVDKAAVWAVDLTSMTVNGIAGAADVLGARRRIAALDRQRGGELC